MASDRFGQSLRARGTRRVDRREDSAPSDVQLLVTRTARAQCKLTDAVARERRVRVAIDEPWDRAQASAVELVDVTVERRQIAHRAGRDDAAGLAEHECALDHIDLAEAEPS